MGACADPGHGHRPIRRALTYQFAPSPSHAIAPHRWPRPGRGRRATIVVPPAPRGPPARGAAMPMARAVRSPPARARAGDRSHPERSGRRGRIRARAVRTPRSARGRRLKSPPTISGVAAPAQRTAAAAARTRLALGLRPRARREVQVGHAHVAPASRSRTNDMRRRSRRPRPGSGFSSRDRLAPAIRHGGRTSVMLDPPSHEPIRSGFQRASRARTRSEPVARGEHDVRGGAGRLRERRVPVRRRLLQQADVPPRAGDQRRELVAQRPVHLHVGLVVLLPPQQQRPPRAQGAVRRRVAAVVEVPRKDGQFAAP